ncbi:MAG TPA: WS/DGAT domain-containing protein, partial [Acidimicrobiia bacterium]|nr:WS/DGAT domain-containing protein [Acidimicrobiia bacterium]
AKLHHSAIDGIAGAEATAALMDLEPVAVGDDPPSGLASEPVPSPWQLVGSACRNAGRRVMPTTRLLARLPGTALRLGIRNRLLEGTPPPGFFTSPRTSLASRLSRRRVAGVTRVDMADVEEVRQASGATVNDVILTLAASAMRLYLEERGELPAEPLCSFVPVAVRADGEDPMRDVNRLSGMLVSLATDVDDPLRRLAVIAESARAAKDQHRVLGEDLFSELAALGVPALLGPTGRLARGLGLTSRFPPFSVVVSSFAGPTFPLYCAGAELLAYHPFGPVVDGAALNITAMSYRGQIGFGLLACAEAVPDVDLLARLIPESMTELTKAVSSPHHRKAGASAPAAVVSARRSR